MRLLNWFYRISANTDKATKTPLPYDRRIPGVAFEADFDDVGLGVVLVDFVPVVVVAVGVDPADEVVLPAPVLVVVVTGVPVSKFPEPSKVSVYTSPSSEVKVKV
jgi:hypothetical protein